MLTPTAFSLEAVFRITLVLSGGKYIKFTFILAQMKEKVKCRFEKIKKELRFSVEMMLSKTTIYCVLYRRILRKIPKATRADNENKKQGVKKF